MKFSKRHHRSLVIIAAFILAALLGVGVWALFFQGTSQAPAPDTSQTDTPHPPEPSEAEKQLACIEALPARVKIGQKLMAAGYNSLLASETKPLARYYVGGIIIMDATPKATISQFKQAFLITPMIGVDQEGGTVQRYTEEGELPGATDMAVNYSAAQAHEMYYKDAAYLSSLGITTNFAPVLDVSSASPNPLPGRMYSDDPDLVSTYATQAIQAMIAADVTPVVKHFPGLGSTTQNTDFGSATTDPLSTLKTRDILPYQKVARLAPDAMIGNAIVPGLTDGQPAIWSAKAVALLRSYGYQNAVVYTDSLTAQAIPGTYDTAAINAWKAGIDIAMIVQTKTDTAGFLQYLPSIVSAAEQALDAGELDNDELTASVARIFARKGIDACSESLADLRS